MDPDQEHQEQIKLLFDYTKFHIGLYTTLAGALVAALGSSFAEDVISWALGLGILLIALAGLCGGVVASSLPDLMSRSALRNEKKKLYEERDRSTMERSAGCREIRRIVPAGPFASGRIGSTRRSGWPLLRSW